MIDNTPEELLAATKELLERHEGCYIASASEAEKANNINAVWRSHMPWNLNIPASFLEHHYVDLMDKKVSIGPFKQRHFVDMRHVLRVLARQLQHGVRKR